MAKRRPKKPMLKFPKRMQKKMIVMFTVVAALMIGLIGRLMYIEYTSGEKYEKIVLAQQGYDSQTIPYQRGDIVDAKGTVLATSIAVYNVILDCSVLNDDEKYVEPTINALVSCFPDMTSEQLYSYLKDSPDSRYIVLAKRLSYDTIQPFVNLQEERDEKGKLVNPYIKGVWFEKEYQRQYPYGKLASSVIGFTTSGNLGINGLENYYDDTLNGINGRQYGYIDGDDNLQRTTEAAVDGYNVYSTIDATIQGIVEKYLKKYNDENKDSTREGNGAQDAACIVMDVHSGEVLAMASYPTFDLNDTRNPEALIGSKLIDVSGNSTDTVINDEIAASMKQEENNDLLVQNLNALWKNYCINSTYEPGSTMKPFVAAMGLEDGRLKGNESFECTGIIEIGGYKIRCHNYTNGAEGWLTIGESIERSCNVTLIRMAQVIGIDEFLKYMSEYNFGLKTNIDLAGEARTASLVFNSSTMGPTELATSSFGQGFNVTMIQMITGFCSLINGGYYYEPHMVSKITAADGSVVKNIEPRLLKQTISAETSEKIREYCVQVVEGANGTGKRAKPAGYRIGGKTGTAETVSASGTREKEDYVVSFLGYAPAEDPQIAIYVVLNRPNAREQDLETRKACIIAKNILTEVLPYLNIFMTQELTDEERAELEAMQIEIREQLSANAPASDVSGNDVSGNTTDTGGDPSAGDTTAGEDGSAAQPAGDDPSTTGGDTANGAEADNPYVNSDGQLIDPTTGEVITEDSDGYDVPVSGILENGAAGDSGGDTQNPME